MEGDRADDSDLWTLDAHCDTWYMQHFLRGTYLPPELQGVDYDAFFRVTLARLNEGRVRCLFLNVGDIGLLASSAMIDALRLQAEEEKSGVSICRSAADVYRAVGSGRLAIGFSCESSFLFLERLDLLRNWHRLGVRVLAISHGEGREGLGWFAGTALMQEPVPQLDRSRALQVTPSRAEFMAPGIREGLRNTETGLTDFERSAVQEMLRLGVICDLSHANDAAFWDALAVAEEQGHDRFCCTHSNCAALCPHTRNLTDPMMEALAERGGVVGLCFYGPYVDEHHPSLDRYVGHVLHALDVMGPDHVGIGSDFDGVQPGAVMAVSHPGRMGALWTALADAGVPTAVLRKIAHENFLRLL